MAKIAPVKGTRDFYPEQMAVRNWIANGWRAASARSGFVEYDGPIFEYLQLYTQKSGDEIAGQLFSLTDRGGRELAIRPEITPTLARMVNQQINSLARPIKWFSIPRLCRAERPQKGRLREFFQWNVDVIGSDNVLADAECIYTAVDYLRSVGLTSNDIVVKFSSRSLLAALLGEIGFADSQLETVYSLLDKRPKLPAETFIALAEEKIPDEKLRSNLMKRLDSLQSASTCGNLFEELCDSTSDSVNREVNNLVFLQDFLGKMGVGGYCEFDINIVRGLAYYTGTVFEIFARNSQLRALCGGGRYDNLLAGLGGPQIPAIGFGMGDVILEILLAEKKLLGSAENKLDFFVVWDNHYTFEKHGLRLVDKLRFKGFSTAFDYRRTIVMGEPQTIAMGKQLKQASTQNARFAVILSREALDSGQITIKNMTTGAQVTVPLEEFMDQPDKYM